MMLITTNIQVSFDQSERESTRLFRRRDAISYLQIYSQTPHTKCVQEPLLGKNPPGIMANHILFCWSLRESSRESKIRANFLSNDQDSHVEALDVAPAFEAAVRMSRSVAKFTYGQLLNYGFNKPAELQSAPGLTRCG